jgi:hypothetical protein
MRIPSLIAIAAFCTAAATGTAGAKGADAKKADSLKAMRVIIKSEMKPDNRVLILENGGFTDSLARLGGHLRRDRFDALIGDTALAREVRTQEEFSRYWASLEERNDVKALKDQYARQDIDRSLIPKKYLFDSTVVLYPGWIIVRKKR